MLTTIDIQSKSFKGGFGYDRKDVDYFISEVIESYDKIYRENEENQKRLELMSKVISQYKSIEKSLQEALLLAQKTADDIKKQAQANAKLIEDEAKHRADLIVADSKDELEHINRKTLALIHQYELYKAQFEQLARTQVQMLRSESFNISSENILKFKKEINKSINDEK